MRRSVLRAALAAAAFAASFTAPVAAFADAAYPQRAVTIVVPFPPGGATDQLARQLAQVLSERFGQPFVVDNKAGAGGRVGARLVARAKPDGYTLIMGTNASHAIAAAIYKDPPYNPITDFAPVSLVARIPMVLMTYPNSPIKTLADVQRLSRDKSARLNFATGGNGTPGHLGLELLKMNMDLEMTHIPFQGGGPAVLALAGKQVELAIDDVSSSLPHIKAGTVVPVAVSGNERSSTLPQVPTLRESGGQGVDFGSWFALFAPAGTPAQALTPLSAAVTEALQTEGVRKVLLNFGAEPGKLSGEAVRSLIADDVAKWRKVAERIQLKLD